MADFQNFPIPTRMLNLNQFQSSVATVNQKASEALADATTASDAATTATTQAGIATTQAGVATGNADNAEAAALQAEAWAESPTAPDPDDPTSKSAKTWAGEAEADADRSEAEADRSATNATATDADATATAADRAATGVARTAAELAASVAGNEIVTSLTDPVPADGTIELLATDPGTQIWKVIDGAWDQVGWLGEVLFDDYGELTLSEAAFEEGTIIRTRKEGLSFLSLASGATDFTATTTGGVKIKHVESPEGSIRLWARMEEDRVKAEAGCPPGVRLGPKWGITPGLLDETALLTASDVNIEITTEEQLETLATGGNGTANNPWQIKNLDLTTQASGMNNVPGLFINMPTVRTYVELANNRIRGWSRGLVRCELLGGSRIELRQNYLDMTYNPNMLNSVFVQGMLNNIDDRRQVEGVEWMSQGNYIKCTPAVGDTPGAAYAQGWNCSFESYDDALEGAVFLKCFEGAFGENNSPNDWGRRTMRVWRPKIIAGYAMQSDINGSLMGCAPNCHLDFEKADISRAAGKPPLMPIVMRPSSSQRWPVKNYPTVRAHQFKIPLTDARGIGIEFADGPDIQHVTGYGNGTTRRIFQIGTPGFQVDIDKRVRRPKVDRVYGEYSGESGGATAEPLMFETCESPEVTRSWVDFTVEGGGDDGIEFYAASGVARYEYNVVTNTMGQILDHFGSNRDLDVHGATGPAECVQAYMVMGTCNTEAVQLTNVQSATVFHVFARTGIFSGTQQTQGSAPLATEDRAAVIAWSSNANNGTDPQPARNITIGGFMPNSWNIGDDTQFKAFHEAIRNGGVPFDGTNSGRWVKDFEREGYNLTQAEIDDLEGR